MSSTSVIHLTSTHHTGILSSQIIRRWRQMNTAQVVLCVRKRPHLYNFHCRILLKYFILSVIVVNFLLCLIYKLNFIIGMHVYMKIDSIHRVWYYPWFQASTEGLGIYPLYIRGEDFLRGSVVKNPLANTRDSKRLEFVPGSRRFPEVGNSNLLQYSCLENSIDRGAWRAALHGVAKSWYMSTNYSVVCPWI